MSIEIYHDPNGPHELNLNQYWGGDEKGVCIQLTGYNCDKDKNYTEVWQRANIGYVGMTEEEARRIAFQLNEWIEGGKDETL